MMLIVPDARDTDFLYFCLSVLSALPFVGACTFKLVGLRQLGGVKEPRTLPASPHS